MNEEISRQLSLMVFNRAKTLIEQETKSSVSFKNPDDIRNLIPTSKCPSGTYKIPEEIVFLIIGATQPKLNLASFDALYLNYHSIDKKKFSYNGLSKWCVDKKTYDSFYKGISYADYEKRCKKEETSKDCPGKIAYEILRKEIHGTSIPFSSLGTNDDKVIGALKLIRNQIDYNVLLFWIYKKEKDARAAGWNVIQWIQNNEYSKASELSRMEASGLPDITGLRKFFPVNYWIQDLNDDVLKQMEKMLKKFNPDEKFESEMLSTGGGKSETSGKSLKDIKIPDIDFGPIKIDMSSFNAQTLRILLPPLTREASHLFLPLIAMAVSMIPGGQALGQYLFRASVTVGVELLDAAIYKYVDGDDYSAGLAVIFAFAGPFDDGLRLLVKSGKAASLLKSLRNKTPLKDEQIEALLKIIKNKSKYERLTKIGMRIMAIGNVLSKVKTISQLFTVVKYLVKVGAIPAKLLGNMGLMVGGSFVTWEVINDKFYKYCNSQPLKELSKSDWAILQKIGSLGPYLQPYSTPCQKIMEDKAKAEAIKELQSIESAIKSFLEEYTNNGLQLSTEMKGEKLLDTAFLQYILMDQKYNLITKYNYSYKTDMNNKVSFYNAKLVSKVAVFDVTANLLGSYVNTNQKSEFSFDTKKGLKGVGVMKIETTDGKKITNKIIFGTSYSSQVSRPTTEVVRFKYGYYDENTKKSVEQFQRDNNLVVDGIFGPSTSSKMLRDFKKYGDIQDYGKIPIQDIEKLRKNAIENLKKNVDEMKKETEEYQKFLDEKNFEKIKKDSVDAINEYLDSFDDLEFNMSTTKKINDLKIQ